MKNLWIVFKTMVSGLVLGACALSYTNVYAQCGWNQGAAQCQEQIQIQEDQTRRNNSGYYENNNSAPVYVPPKASKYGAVAQNPKTGAMGMSNLQASKLKAKRLALADCGESDCKIISAYANTCMAHAYGSNGFWALRNEPSIQASEKSALVACSEKDSNCQIFFSGCSLP